MLVLICMMCRHRCTGFVYGFSNFNPLQLLQYLNAVAEVPKDNAEKSLC